MSNIRTCIILVVVGYNLIIVALAETTVLLSKYSVTQELERKELTLVDLDLNDVRRTNIAINQQGSSPELEALVSYYTNSANQHRVKYERLHQYLEDKEAIDYDENQRIVITIIGIGLLGLVTFCVGIWVGYKP